MNPAPAPMILLNPFMRPPSQQRMRKWETGRMWRPPPSCQFQFRFHPTKFWNLRQLD
ncbi:hypothetical protein K438DRAFT_1863459 [Mycena galopus ATCC 62051]|nr:hypothetical protein K438DRAFT_1863459 [Mycena galopus ATCC 62051]